jgi:tetratricopeptide (TPR) repeat protein
LRGKLDQAEFHFRDLIEASEVAGSVPDYHQAARDLAYGHLLVKRDTARAQEVLNSALAQYPLESIEFLGRPYTEFAAAYAMADRFVRAKVLLEALRDSIPQDMGGRFRLEMTWARGWIAVAEDRLEGARAEFQRLEGPNHWVYRGTLGLGMAFDRMEQPDSAVSYYERLLATHSNYRWYLDARWLPLVLERLGQLHEEQGNPEKAAEYNGRFVELWAEADSDLQPRVEAVRRALERLESLTADSTASR